MTKREDDRRHLGEDLSTALRLRRQGYDEAAIVAFLVKHHPRYGYHSRIYQQTLERRGSVAARRYATETARQALKIASIQPRVFTPDEARERLQAIWVHLDAQPWPLELAGARRALEAAFSIAFERGRVANMMLDTRTHAMRAGQSLDAVTKNRRKLHELGWLVRNTYDRGNLTSRFSFHCPPNIEETFLESSYVRDDVVLAHDAFRPHALGDQGWSRFLCFARRPEIAEEVLE